MSKSDTIKYQGNDYATVPGFGDYAVSVTGEVISRLEPGGLGRPTKNWRKLRPYKERDGYLRVKFYNKVRFGVHQVVAMTYLSNPFNKPQVNHIDGNKANNSLSNLEYVTAAENYRHAVDMGLIVHRKRNEPDYSQPIVGTHESSGSTVWFPSMSDAERYGYRKGCISLVCQGKRRLHKGLTWRAA